MPEVTAEAFATANAGVELSGEKYATLYPGLKPCAEPGVYNVSSADVYADAADPSQQVILQMNKLMLSLAALGLAAGAAYAQDETSFASLDTDANGELSFEEITVAWPQLTQEEFAAADLDASGGLSGDEVAAMQGAAAEPAPDDSMDTPTTTPEDVAPPAEEVPSESS